MYFNVGEPIGEFDVKSGKLRVTDPCYDDDTWCAGVLKNVKNGKWEAYAYVEDYGQSMLGGERVKNLTVFHKDHKNGFGLTAQTAEFEVGVDSGQAGFFDDEVYPHGEREETGHWNKDEFYDKCCDATCGRDSKGEGYGIIDDRGVVSNSGWGDGGYTCNYYTDKDGQVVAAEIIFIGDEDDEDEDGEEEFHCSGCGATVDEFETLCEDCEEAADELEKEDDDAPA